VKRWQPEVSKFTNTGAPMDRRELGLSRAWAQTAGRATDCPRELHIALQNAAQRHRRISLWGVRLAVRSSGSLQECSPRMLPAWCWWIRRQEEYYNWTQIRDPRASDDERQRLSRQASLRRTRARVPEGIPGRS